VPDLQKEEAADRSVVRQSCSKPRHALHTLCTRAPVCALPATGELPRKRKKADGGDADKDADADKDKAGVGMGADDYSML
jgi:hypothetical protein